MLCELMRHERADIGPKGNTGEEVPHIGDLLFFRFALTLEQDALRDLVGIAPIARSSIEESVRPEFRTISELCVNVLCHHGQDGTNTRALPWSQETIYEFVANMTQNT